MLGYRYVYAGKYILFFIFVRNSSISASFCITNISQTISILTNPSQTIKFFARFKPYVSVILIINIFRWQLSEKRNSKKLKVYELTGKMLAYDSGM
ncbi:hypothetical protein HOLleu_43382 [Holothuria leucospilota]|uniref:Uncharacterized protein n=1 Tax=Holothuria leucospilota TaxID=206669 RepID=A0A9Q1BB39_HOLLE|nr:hypothetical protein HOLleu_43382 [Holothuria leucospilota]